MHLSIKLSTTTVWHGFLLSKGRKCYGILCFRQHISYFHLTWSEFFLPSHYQDQLENIRECYHIRVSKGIGFEFGPRHRDALGAAIKIGTPPYAVIRLYGLTLRILKITETENFSCITHFCFIFLCIFVIIMYLNNNVFLIFVLLEILFVTILIILTFFSLI